MQTADEQDALALQIVATAEVIGTVISANAAAMIAEDLECYPFAACREALKKCRAEVRGRLTLSDVVNRVNSQDGRPGRDEAWSIALQSADERDTVVWTAEIMTAYDAARPILMAGDKVGARMAFISAYDRLVQSAREALRPAHWIASFGWDGERRQLALESAVRLERLSVDRAEVMGYLAAPVTAEGRALIGLVAVPTTSAMLALTTDERTRKALEESELSTAGEQSPEFRARLQKLREDVAQGAKNREEERVAWIAAQAEDLARKKRAVQKAVDERLGGAV